MVKGCALEGMLDCSQQNASIPARARTADTREHWEKSCAVLGKKKLAAECFSKFFKSNCRDLKITQLRAAPALP